MFRSRKKVKFKVKAKKGGGLLAKAKAGITTAGIVVALKAVFSWFGMDPETAPEGSIHAVAQMLMFAVDNGEAFVAFVFWMWPSSPDDVPEVLEA